MQTATLERVEVDIETEEQDAQYDDWLRAKVQEAIDDPRPPIAHAAVMAEVRQMIAVAKAKHITRQQSLTA